MARNRDTQSYRDDGEQRAISGRAIAAIMLTILGLVFVFQNFNTGTVNFLFWTMTMPAWVWILIVLILGVAIGSLFPWFRPKKR